MFSFEMWSLAKLEQHFKALHPGIIPISGTIGQHVSLNTLPLTELYDEFGNPRGLIVNYDEPYAKQQFKFDAYVKRLHHDEFYMTQWAYQLWYMEYANSHVVQDIINHYNAYVVEIYPLATFIGGLFDEELHGRRIIDLVDSASFRMAHLQLCKSIEFFHAIYREVAENTKTEMIAWLSCAKRLNLHRDVSRLIAEYVWATRFEDI